MNPPPPPQTIIRRVGGSVLGAIIDREVPFQFSALLLIEHGYLL